MKFQSNSVNVNKCIGFLFVRWKWVPSLGGVGVGAVEYTGELGKCDGK